jgi:hypothetical protein
LEKLTEKTWVPLGLAVVVISAVAGWVMRTELTASSTASRMSVVFEHYHKIDEKLDDVDRRLIRIETLLRQIKDARE